MTVAVGVSVPRKDGMGKATGQARYADDLVFPGMLHARTIRTTIPCGRLTNVRLEFDPAGYTIVDHRDIPASGRNVIALIENDQPCLVEREIRHVAEPVMLLAHENREALWAAHVELSEEPYEPLFDPELSPKLFKEILIEKGGAQRAMSRAAVVVEGTYRTGHQEHVYIEPNGVIAVPEDGGIAVYGSIQCPFYVHKALVALLGSSVNHVRVVQTETGGGFGGKEEYPSMISAHAALLALKAKRPVKLIYDREEDMLATTKRHPSIVKHRTGVRKDGRLVAMEVDVLLDGGAYVTLSPVVLSRGAIHAAGPYRCDNTRIHARAVMTNTAPNGAFRGFGAPQTQFAMEVQMDRIAEALGMDPVRLRRLNALRPGDTTATGQKLGSDCSAHEVLRTAVRRSAFTRKRAEYKGTRRGIGLALFYHGSGFTGSGE
ncbi:MAG TPA: xanthine dehydrogenase family protein, partial [Gemmatimonadaceae bacterium]